jgi:hypothetical protein
VTRDVTRHSLCYRCGVTKQPPPGVHQTTLRIPADLLKRLRDSSRLDHRTVNAQVVTLLTEALDTRDRERTAR